MSTVRRVSLSVLAVLVLLVGLGFAPGSASAAAPAAAAVCQQYHTVKAGETLFEIGLAYGVNWRDLATMNNLQNPRVIYVGQKLCVSTTTTSGGTSGGTGGRIPTFRIVSVVKDKSVTIETANFPANDTFDVLMGPYKTQAINGTKATAWKSGAGGRQTVTFDFPASMVGRTRIAIRLQSSTGSGYFAYNWFWNNTSGTGTGGGGEGTGGSTGKPAVVPTFSIRSVARDNTVTIRTANFPANTKFDVRMGRMGTRGVNGTLVTTIDSGTGGSFDATFNIPAGLAGRGQIAIRLESTSSGHFAYNWFWNNNAP